MLMVLSAVMFSAMSVMVKFLSDQSTFLITFMRFITGLIFLMFLYSIGKIKFNPKNLPWLFVRGVFGALAVMLLYLGITKIGLGKGTMLNYTYPVFATLFSPILLKEKNKPIMWIMQGIALIGCYFLLNPKGFFHFAPIDMLVLFGGMCAGIAVNSIKKLTLTDSTYTIFLSFCLFSSIMYVYPAFHHFHSIPTTSWILLISVGVLGTVGQLSMTYGYKFTPVNEGSIIAFLVPAFNVILGVLLFSEKMTFGMVIGSILIIGSCIFTALQNSSGTPSSGGV
ncbi:MAG TPA: DMT family transporter [Candidatus Cloacimonadota bacterium]|nr:DMT family transporter [Candidatus Cloacimonadota bacterium]HPT71365.1 DMT family transporter [Candidatus Cloacimonadota bacterium]